MYGLTVWLKSSLFLLAQGAGEAAPVDNQPANILQQILGNPLNLILFSLVLFMLLVVRPQRNEMKRMQQLVSSLKKNDRIVTSGGIHGTVIQANSGEPTIVIRIDENSGARMTINRESISRVVADSDVDKKS